MNLGFILAYKAKGRGFESREVHINLVEMFQFKVVKYKVIITIEQILKELLSWQTVALVHLSLYLKVPSSAKKIIKWWTKAAPDPSPAIVTLLGSPPKLTMLSLTHRKARRMSLRPMLPGSTMSPVDKNPALLQNN